jgi:hypothetical protein
MTNTAIQRQQRPLGPSVSIDEAWERAYWSFELGIDEADLVDIVVMTGGRVEDVQREVERRRQQGV